MSECILYKKLDNKKVRCTCCALKCIIPNQETGECGVRKNRNGKLYLEIYGRPTAVAVDPIEKKPLYQFYPKSTAFSIGTFGCNFKCSFCQNWDLSQASKSNDIENLTNVYDLPPKKVIQMCKKKNCKVIAYTYNEPTIFTEYALDCAKLAQKEGIKNVYVSNGYQTVETIELLAPYLDAINIDLKAFTNRFYQELTGVRLSPVLKNIKRWHDLGVWVEVTTLIIPGENDSEEELTNIANYIASINVDIPWHVSAYYDAYKMKGKGRTPLQSLLKAYKLGKEAGLHHIYTGNVQNDKTEITYCPKCNTRLIDRSGYFTKVHSLKNGKCKKCGTPIKGIWSDSCQNLLVPKKVTDPKEIHAILYPEKAKQSINYFEGSTFDRDHQILILYGTQTGKTEQIANQLYQLFIHSERTKKSFDFRIVDLDEYNPENLPLEKNIILLTSTHGEGDPPDNALALFEYLESKNVFQDASLLEGLTYSIFGLGNSSYGGQYQKMSKYFDTKFELLGAERLYQRGEGDEFKNNIQESFKKWFNNLISSLCENLGVKEQINKMPMERSLLKIKYLENEIEIESENKNEKEKEKEKGNEMELENFSTNKSNKIYDSKNPFQSKLLEKNELMTNGGGRSCLQLKLDLKNSNIKYNCGDHIGILPSNSVHNITKLAKILNVNLDQKIQITPPRRFKKTMTIRECFEKYCEITGPVPNIIFQTLSKYTKDQSEQKRLLEWYHNINKYNEWNNENRYGLIHILEKFPNIQLTLENFLQFVPRIAARYYSISSCPQYDSKSVQVTAQLLENGLCSNYFNDLKINDPINLFWKKTNFKLNNNHPSILIATGTGIAPFRGMLRERLYLKENQIQENFPETFLFFGCRTHQYDFIYEDEFDKYSKHGLITNSFFAFSRDQQNKIYVQHKLKEQKELVQRVMKNKNGQILVCGILKMSLQIKETLSQIFGKKLLKTFIKSNRYNEEIW
ncbi:flavodoxin family protein [Anaeramoeba flamelloides]|uniref:Flavodoxin family protein n=1 Tax=Anaeramoeba flamelloides TaxID=1746091 RepID=A0AAV7YL83_9EUKA|nr:flavodoxin family protein [Anaeramoeba flamelloides]